MAERLAPCWPCQHGCLAAVSMQLGAGVAHSVWLLYRCSCLKQKQQFVALLLVPACCNRLLLLTESQLLLSVPGILLAGLGKGLGAQNLHRTQGASQVVTNVTIPYHSSNHNRSAAMHQLACRQLNSRGSSSIDCFCCCRFMGQRRVGSLLKRTQMKQFGPT